MFKVKRFNHCIDKNYSTGFTDSRAKYECIGMQESESGIFVRYTSWLRLKRENKRLKKIIAKLENKKQIT